MRLVDRIPPLLGLGEGGWFDDGRTRWKGRCIFLFSRGEEGVEMRCFVGYGRSPESGIRDVYGVIFLCCIILPHCFHGAKNEISNPKTGGRGRFRLVFLADCFAVSLWRSQFPRVAAKQGSALALNGWAGYYCPLALLLLSGLIHLSTPPNITSSCCILLTTSLTYSVLTLPYAVLPTPLLYRRPAFLACTSCLFSLEQAFLLDIALHLLALAYARGTFRTWQCCLAGNSASHKGEASTGGGEVPTNLSTET